MSFKTVGKMSEILLNSKRIPKNMHTSLTMSIFSLVQKNSLMKQGNMSEESKKYITKLSGKKKN
jgi:hypothetical protein